MLDSGPTQRGWCRAGWTINFEFVQNILKIFLYDLHSFIKSGRTWTRTRVLCSILNQLKHPMTKKLRYLTRVLPVFLASSVSVYAQDALSSFQEPDRVIVTGSLIPTAEEVTASPVDTIGAREIQRSGSVEVLQILQKREADITGAGNLGSTNANIASGATVGGSIIQIRGLPTLVLDEGRRITDSAALAAGGFQFSDINLFPSSLVSRIEVLKEALRRCTVRTLSA